MCNYKYTLIISNFFYNNYTKIHFSFQLFRYELKNIEIIWAIRHSSISATFFDEGAAEFFKPMLRNGMQEKESAKKMTKRYRLTIDNDQNGDIMGSALGPDWSSTADISGSLDVCDNFISSVLSYFCIFYD